MIIHVITQKPTSFVIQLGLIESKRSLNKKIREGRR